MDTIAIKQEAARTKIHNLPAHLDPDAVKGLIARVAGQSYAAVFEVIPYEGEDDGVDAYRVSDCDGRLVIQATSGVAAAVAFNRYLQERCDAYIGPLTERLRLPVTPPPVGEPLAARSRFYYRYLFNYCTFGYTYAFTDWAAFERVLDYALLSGYNLILNPIGHEQVWRRVLPGLGYTQEEADAWIAGPAFTPWQWMMNMSGWGGPVLPGWCADQAALSKRFNQRLRSFGCGIVLPGYCGMVPRDFEQRFPGAKVVEQGGWCGYDRPSILLPEDPLFDRVADLFYTEQQALSDGTAYAHYYSTDPFHEGGNTGDIALDEYARRTYAAMRRHDPDAVWFFQGWQINPRREMVTALEPSQVLVANLLADNNLDGGGDNFGGRPWLYCTVNNFGGQRLLRGCPVRSLERPYEALGDAYTMVGVGYMPEGVEADEIFYDILADCAVREEAPAMDTWLAAFVHRRYGRCSDALLDAWRLLVRHVYTGDGITGPRESALLTRPSLDADRVSTWGSPVLTYDNRPLIEACRLLLTAYEELADVAPYRFDLADCVRQAVANHGWRYIDAMRHAYGAGDAQAFDTAADAFLALYPLQEAVVATSPRMLLGRWLRAARDRGHTTGEKAYMEWNARSLITIWADRSGAVELHDYAAREWQGLLADFYRPRWERFIRRVQIAMAAGTPIPACDAYEQEAAFTYETKAYPTEPFGDLRAAAEEALAQIG